MTELTHDTPELELFELPEGATETWHDLDSEDDTDDEPEGAPDGDQTA